jgi:Spx/MgsR family transcriptional regulator
MTPIHLYGLPNCDTVKKARAWLAAHGLAHEFHDYKKEGANAERLRAWNEAVGWEALLNRRGTTFRGLPEADKAGLEEARALALMAAHPSLIRRPVVEHAGGLLVGFDEADWAGALG